MRRGAEGCGRYEGVERCEQERQGAEGCDKARQVRRRGATGAARCAIVRGAQVPKRLPGVGALVVRR